MGLKKIQYLFFQCILIINMHFYITADLTYGISISITII